MYIKQYVILFLGFIRRKSHRLGPLNVYGPNMTQLIGEPQERKWGFIRPADELQLVTHWDGPPNVSNEEVRMHENVYTVYSM